MERGDFEHLLPHAGGMCLIDRVVSWDQQRIRCSAASHRSARHPLAEQGRLHAVCGVEYAAQAIALHGALVGASRGARSGPPGYLAGIRRLKLARLRLDDLASDLIIDADCELVDGGGLLYDFAVMAGEDRLLDGRLSILFDRT